MGVSRISSVWSSDAGGECVAQRDDASRIATDQHVRRIGGDVPGPLAIAGKLLREASGDEWQIHLSGGSKPGGCGRWSPTVVSVTGRQVDQLVDDIREISRYQLGSEESNEVAGFAGAIRRRAASAASSASRAGHRPPRTNSRSAAMAVASAVSAASSSSESTRTGLNRSGAALAVSITCRADRCSSVDIGPVRGSDRSSRSRCPANSRTTMPSPATA